MDTARIRPVDAITGALGALLLASLFLDWYSLPQGGASGWGSFGVLDFLLALVALLAIAVPIVTAVRDAPAWPVAMLVLTTAFAFLVGLFMLYRLLDQPGPDPIVDAAAGGYVGPLALLGTFVAAAHALRDERAPAIASPGEIPVMPAPPREAPAGSNPSQEPA